MITGFSTVSVFLMLIAIGIVGLVSLIYPSFSDKDIVDIGENLCLDS